MRGGRARLVACVLGLAVFVPSAAAQPVERPDLPRLLVIPFENVAHDTRLVWIGEASAVLLADDLNALGASAITRDERRQAFERLQVPPSAALTDATVIRIGQIVGAAQVVVGTIEMSGDLLVVHARAIALESGRVAATVTERGPLADLFALFERIARRLAPPSSTSSDEIERQHPSVVAFEAYVKGLLAQTPATAINYLTQALKLQPSFDRVRLALWDVYEEEGEHEQALASVQKVPPDSPWASRARFLAGLAQVSLQKYDDAFATFKALADARPTATVLNNLGVVQLQRAATPQTGLPVYYFDKAVTADPDDPDYYFNLGYAYWAGHDTQAAVYWLREAVRRNPADGDAHFVLGAALAVGGNATEANRERELARRLSSSYDALLKRPPAEAVPKGLERIKSDIELPHARRLEAAIVTGEQRDQHELALFYLDRARRLFGAENDRDGMSELERVLYLSPYEAEAHLLVGRIHLRNGRLREAIDALKISLWSHETADAHVALGEAYLQAKDAAAARTEGERALAIDPASNSARRLLEKAGSHQ